MDTSPNPYVQLIQQEQAKIIELRQRISECEQRIEVLTGLVPRDELDDALAKVLQSKTATAGAQEANKQSPIPPSPVDFPAQTVEPAGEIHSGPGSQLSEKRREPGRRPPESALKLLAYLREPRSRDEMDAFTRNSGHVMSRSALSTFVWAYRSQYGFVEVLEDGKAVLNDRGQAYLAKVKPAGPVGPGPAVDETQADRLPESDGVAPEGGS